MSFLETHILLLLLWLFYGIHVYKNPFIIIFIETTYNRLKQWRANYDFVPSCNIYFVAKSWSCQNSKKRANTSSKHPKIIPDREVIFVLPFNFLLAKIGYTDRFILKQTSSNDLFQSSARDAKARMWSWLTNVRRALSSDRTFCY